VTSHNTDGQPTPDEHQRFAHYLQDLATVGEADEADLVATVPRDPDHAMAQSAVVRHLNNRAAHLLPLPDQRFEHWAHAMANQISELDFLTRRLYEWTLLRSQPGQTLGRSTSHHRIRLVPAQGRRDGDLTHRPYPARQRRKNTARPRCRQSPGWSALTRPRPRTGPNGCTSSKVP
jgi:hypothetical protein